MGILDNLKQQVEKLGDKAKGGLGEARDKAGDLLDDARDKAGDLLDDAKERFGNDDETPPLTESSDVGPDTSSTDAVAPGYVAAEDDASEDSDESSLDEVSEGDSDDSDYADPTDSAAEDVDVVEEELLVAEPAGPSDVVPPAAAELDPVDLDAQEVDASDDAADLTAAPADGQAADVDAADEQADEQAGSADEPAVTADVDPYDQPLTESIGDELAAAGLDPQDVAEAVGTTSTERDTSA